MKLLPKGDLIRTSEVDHADWNYEPLLEHVARQRFALIRKLLPRERVQRMLEVGFGSGVFMPELSASCDELYGIDVHDRVEEVARRLAHRGIASKLSRESAARMHFSSRFFDAIVAVSALEFIDDIQTAASEIARVLKPRGHLVAVMPADSRLLDSLLHVVTGADARKDYGDRRERVMPALLNHFRIVRRAAFPPVYRAYSLEPIRGI